MGEEFVFVKIGLRLGAAGESLGGFEEELVKVVLVSFLPEVVLDGGVDFV